MGTTTEQKNLTFHAKILDYSFPGNPDSIYSVEAAPKCININRIIDNERTAEKPLKVIPYLTLEEAWFEGDVISLYLTGGESIALIILSSSNDEPVKHEEARNVLNEINRLRQAAASRPDLLKFGPKMSGSDFIYDMKFWETLADMIDLEDLKENLPKDPFRASSLARSLFQDGIILCITGNDYGPRFLERSKNIFGFTASRFNDPCDFLMLDIIEWVKGKRSNYANLDRANRLLQNRIADRVMGVGCLDIYELYRKTGLPIAFIIEDDRDTVFQPRGTDTYPYEIIANYFIIMGLIQLLLGNLGNVARIVNNMPGLYKLAYNSVCYSAKELSGVRDIYNFSDEDLRKENFPGVEQFIETRNRKLKKMEEYTEQAKLLDSALKIRSSGVKLTIYDIKYSNRDLERHIQKLMTFIHTWFRPSGEMFNRKGLVEMMCWIMAWDAIYRNMLNISQAATGIDTLRSAVFL